MQEKERIRVSFFKQGCKMNDSVVINRGQGLKARLGGTPLPKRPLSTLWNRVSQWGGSFDD